MPIRTVGLPSDVPPVLVDGLAALRSRLGVPDPSSAGFPADVLAHAGERAAAVPSPAVDRTDLELITIDPPGSHDLDQAMHIAVDGDGYQVSYAIADVAAWVTPGDPVDLEAHRRGVTLYAPNVRTPLHPSVLSEQAASLLPGEDRPALLWTLRLDASGKLTDADVSRATVRSREQLTYEQAQTEIDGGSPRQTLALLARVGELRMQRERDRGGVSLQIPDQEVRTDSGRWTLEFRAPLAVDGWNAQISLLTGVAAADMMLYGQVGILRTLPEPDRAALRRLRQTAKALHIRWLPEQDYPEFVRGLDPARPDHAAMLDACTSLFRGAGYRAFNGSIPEDVEHAALASEYAHTTAPLGRLVDRYAGEICLALCAGVPVPDWVLRALDALPEEMMAAERRASAYERAILDLVEIFVLADRVGEVFTGTVIDVEASGDRGVVLLKEPAVEGRVHGTDLPLGHEVSLRLSSADLAHGAVEFELA